MKELFFSDFLNEITYKSTYKFLVKGSDDEEIAEIAAKRGIVLPAEDLAPFKCIFAYVDEENKNGCTLPKKEVEASLQTLVGKAVDFDHLRKKVVGHWVDAKLEGDTIIAYGLFFKNNLEEDYETIKELMEEDVLAISFEAWGSRDITNEKDGSYDLTDIEFAGGALLIKTTPAFPGAQVLELSSKKDDKRVLEMASALKQPDELLKIRDKEEKKGKEKGYYDSWDIESIRRIVSEAKKPKGYDDYYWEITSIDFENSVAKVKYYDYSEGIESYIYGEVKLTSEIKLIKSSDKGEDTKEKMKMAKDENKLAIEELEKVYASTIEEKDTEIAKLKETTEGLTSELASLKEEFDLFKADVDVKIETAKKEASVVVERRAELADFAKDLSDEQILDDKDFKIAKLEKENADLKVSKKDPEKSSLEAGSKKTTSGDKLLDIQKSIHEKAWK